jgi:hypothetical protein
MNGASWVKLVDAVRTVRDARGVSEGAAFALLCKACAADVRSRKRPWREEDEPPEPIYDRWSPPIPRPAWHDASIDLDYGWLILAGGEIVRADIEINVDDLRHWLGIGRTEVQPVPRRAAKRGPPPTTLEATKTRMRNDIDAGRYTAVQLRDMKQEALAKTYDVSRETARKALDAMLSEFPTNSITDK